MAVAVQSIEEDQEHLGRLKAHEQWLLSSNLDPIYEGLQQKDFQAVVHQFAAERAADFTVVCTDGSQPLIWTQYHQQYKELFELQIESTLSSMNMSKAQFQSCVNHLQEVRSSLGKKAEDIDSFLRTLTAADEYETFLHVMFIEVRRQQIEAEAAAADATATCEGHHSTQEIVVVAPEGTSPGQLLAVEYMGVHYELLIPEGCEAGMSFAAEVILPSC
eukprot:TRINITY_DN8497_c0_g1_i1.p1 TRINITY_DN8497_c0_g1~~TRINITY_DN8497_c0_g1_i1.p1  ORF type:complete len:218 (+),score=62.12 TRINITY_DN8497_c0_g1_i1:147-800(+)